MSVGDNAGVNVLGRANTVKATSSLGIDTFRTGVDDFDEWIDMFERAVKLASNAPNEATAYPIYIKWLPLKLDTEARALATQSTGQDWPTIKAQLKALFLDPQEAYRWQAKTKTIAWDGTESFHALGAKIVAAINKYDKDMPQAFKEREAFFRFRDAVPNYFQDQIDVFCGTGDRTLANAKEAAQRAQMTNMGREAVKQYLAQGTNKPKGVLFAAMNDDRMSGVEMAIAGITTQMDTLKASLRVKDDKIRTMEDRIRILEEKNRRLEYQVRRQTQNSSGYRPSTQGSQSSGRSGYQGSSQNQRGGSRGSGGNRGGRGAGGFRRGNRDQGANFRAIATDDEFSEGEFDQGDFEEEEQGVEEGADGGYAQDDQAGDEEINSLCAAMADTLNGFLGKKRGN